MTDRKESIINAIEKARQGGQETVEEGQNGSNETLKCQSFVLLGQQTRQQGNNVDCSVTKPCRHLYIGIR